MPNSPSITPPWLAKLNSLNETVEKVISPVQSTLPNPIQMEPGIGGTGIQTEPQIEFKTGGLNVETVSNPAPESQAPESHNVVTLSVAEGVISVPADLPPGHYDAVLAAEIGKAAQGNLSAFNFDPTAFQQAISINGQYGKFEADPVELPVLIADGMNQNNVKQVDADYVATLQKDKVALNQSFGKLGVQEEAMETDIPSMPDTFKPVVEVELPIVDAAPAVVEYVSPDNNQPAVSEEEYYAAIVEQLAQSNPSEAQLIARLRLFQSQYVGLITSPEQAIDHIAKCRFHGVPIGGSDAVELPAQSTSLKHKEYIARRYAPHKAKKEAVESARNDWKKAIADREAAMGKWDSFVKWHHENYNRLKKMDASLFVEEVKQDEVN